MGQTEKLIIDVVKKAYTEYYVNRNADDIMSHCASMDMPLIGLIKPDWEEEFEIVTDYQHVDKIHEEFYVVSVRVNLKDVSLYGTNDKEILVDGTFTCTYKEDEVKFCSVHLSVANGAALRNEYKIEKEQPYYKKVLKSVYDVIFEFDRLSNTFTYDAVKNRELFEVDRHFVSMDQWFWHMCTECVHKDDTECLDIFRSNDIGKRIRNNDCVIEKEIRIRNREKGYIWVKMIVVFIPNKARDNIEKVFIMFKNIDEKKRLEMDYITKSRIDSLTGLYNREYTEQLISKLLETKTGAQGIYIIVDIDEFKSINDTFGHITGDEVLRKTARVLYNSIGNNDIIGRIGGDEFVIFLSDCNDEKIAKSRIANILKNIQFEYSESKKAITIRCSAGAAIAGSGSSDIRKLYERADENLYEAKRAGKNTFRITAC